jgi:hypothetical protein
MYKAFNAIKALNPNVTTIMYLNSMFNFAMYNLAGVVAANEAAGTPMLVLRIQYHMLVAHIQLSMMVAPRSLRYPHPIVHTLNTPHPIVKTTRTVQPFILEFVLFEGDVDRQPGAETSKYYPLCSRVSAPMFFEKSWMLEPHP